MNEGGVWGGRSIVGKRRDYLEKRDPEGGK